MEILVPPEVAGDFGSTPASAVGRQLTLTLQLPSFHTQVNALKRGLNVRHHPEVLLNLNRIQLGTTQLYQCWTMDSTS